MIEDFLSKIDLSQLFNILAGVTAFFVAYLKILPLIPRSSVKILSDLEVYEKSKISDIINSEIIKDAIEREVQRKYRVPTKIYSYSTFFISFTILITVGYFLYSRIVAQLIDTNFFFLALIAFGSYVGLLASFDKPKIENKPKTTLRQPVFKFEIFSWGELFGGVLTILIFGFWTFKRFFRSGEFNYDWWGLLTFVFMLSGFGILTGAFKNQKDSEKKGKPAHNN